ncbi:hypothetical protein BDF19DRAFT_434928 [Syncephalis fuscata]|nr:hypothetical protein BDF19DRAFT_434928 [Syncephalis fuscata]
MSNMATVTTTTTATAAMATKHYRRPLNRKTADLRLNNTSTIIISTPIDDDNGGNADSNGCDDHYSLLNSPPAMIPNGIATEPHSTLLHTMISKHATPSDDYTDDDGEYEELPPVVVVDGFLSCGLPDYWGPLEELFAEDLKQSRSSCNEHDPLLIRKKPTQRRVLFVTPGCSSSLHDRACEIFYQLKGGIVDYGEKHACQFDHARFGRGYRGLYPQWSAEKPIHFIGHSLGGNTLLALQQLLTEKHFSDHATSPDMMVSLTALCSPLNGTPFVHSMGAKEGSALGPIRIGHGGWWLSRLAHIYEYLGLRLAYDFNLDHWGFRTEFNPSLLPLESSEFEGNIFVLVFVWLYVIAEYLYTLISRFGQLCRFLVFSPCYDRFDNLATDSVPAMCAKFNAKWQPSKRTWYRSYTTSINDISIPSQALNMPSWILFLGQKIVKRGVQKAFNKPADFGQSIGRCKQCHSTDDWLKGDGVVPLPSQFHPHCCCQLNCLHDVLYDNTNDGTTSEENAYASQPPLPGSGHWETVNVANSHHVGIVPYRSAPKNTTPWNRVFNDYARWLRQIDEARADPPYSN